jgi:hypothetical protein
MWLSMGKNEMYGLGFGTAQILKSLGNSTTAVT